VCLVCVGQAKPQTSRRDKALVAAEDRALNLIASTVEHANRLVIVEFRSSGQFMLPAPIRIEAVVPDADVVRQLRAMLAHDKKFRVATDPDEVITVCESGVPQDVLGIGLKRVELSETERFNPDQAMDAVFDAPEVKAYFRAHNITRPIDIGGFISGPNPDRPHLEPSIENMTVLNALKHILAVFPHTALYNESIDPRGRRVVSVGFWDSH
jgi:hypothetical protein